MTVGIILFLTGFLLQWTTLLTLAMYPLLVVMYVHLARHDEKAAIAEFGDAYRGYIARTGSFFPNGEPEDQIEQFPLLQAK